MRALMMLVLDRFTCSYLANISDPRSAKSTVPFAGHTSCYNHPSQRKCKVLHPSQAWFVPSVPIIITFDLMACCGF